MYDTPEKSPVCHLERSEAYLRMRLLGGDHSERGEESPRMIAGRPFGRNGRSSG